jgi:mannose-1-phosphate guanylyltransferase
MRAMMLAAGRGERMMPLTDDLPKPALGVLGPPLAVHLLRWLRRHGVDRTIMNLHHRPQSLARTLTPYLGEDTPELTYSFEAELLGSGGGLANARHFFEKEDIIVVINSDALFDVDLGAALRQHQNSGLPATLVCIQAREGYGIVEVDDSGRILSLSGEPPVEPERVAGRMTFTGIHLLDRSLYPDLMREGEWNLRDLYRELAADDRLGFFAHEGFWWEFGLPAQFLEGCLRLLRLDTKSRHSLIHCDPVETIGGAQVASGTGVQRADDIRFEGGVALGFTAFVSEGCLLRDSVVLRESWIGPGTSLDRVIVGPHTEVPANLTLDRCIVMRDTHEQAYHREGLIRQDGLLIRKFDR